MIRKTEAIVLKSRKFQESSLLVTLYSPDLGKLTCVVPGIRSPRATKRHSYFQPLSCIDVVMYVKETRDLQKITESSLHHFWNRIQTNQSHLALAIVAIEIFDHVIREEEDPNPALYKFLKNFLVSLDEAEEHLIHRFLFFMIHLTAFAGFFPHNEVKDPEGKLFFDVANGVLMNVPVNPNVGKAFMAFLDSDPESCVNIPLGNLEKKAIIQQMLEYFRHHIEGFREPGSLQVFGEVLRD